MKGGMAKQDQSAAKKQEVILLEVKIDSHVNRVIGDSGNSGTVARP